jgi:hypothetical protein
MWNLRPDRFNSLPFPEQVPEDLGGLFDTIVRVYLPYLDANAAAYANKEALVRYQVRDTSFIEPVKPYRVWCRDRLQCRLAELDDSSRAEVQRALGSSAAVTRLATPSARRAEEVIASLPVTARLRSKAVDSWWRE